MEILLSRVRSRFRFIAVGLCVGAVCLLGAARFDVLNVVFAAGRPQPVHTLAAQGSAPDTIVVFGPKQFVTAKSATQLNFVESFPVPTGTASPTNPTWHPNSTLYTVRLQRVGGSLTTATVTVNGKQIAAVADFASAPYIERIVLLNQAANNSNTVSVTLKGAKGAGLIVTVAGTPFSHYAIFGPKNYTKTSATPTRYTETFALPAGATPPYHIAALASASGTKATITFNGVIVIKDADFTNTTLVVRGVSPVSGSNSLKVDVRGNTGTNVYVLVTATDKSAPVLTITSPEPNLATSATTIAVTGTSTDRDPTKVTVNGVLATMSGAGNTQFSATVPLNEGPNTLAIRATDLAGNHTDSSRTVTRDTQAPTLAISTPTDNSYSNQVATPVSGTASGASAVTVNGVSFPVGQDGTFSGSYQLAPGANFITAVATDVAGNSVSATHKVTLDTDAPVITVASPAEGSQHATQPVVVSGTVRDATSADKTTLTVNGAAVLPGAFSDPTTFNFSTEIALAAGSNAISVVATDGAGNASTVTRTVTFGGDVGGVPPDPATVAPPLDATVATTTFAATSFLYTGPNPIQTGVAPGTIQKLQAAGLRGAVKTRQGTALPGVKITVQGHPEFGQTLSRADGAFDLVVNGGRQITLNYEKAGYLPVQRQAVVPWRDYVRVDSVTMVNLDPASTVIDFSQPAQAAQGSVVTDESGTRRATMIFKGGTQASLVMPNGTTQALGSLTVRATEYTVGPTGPSAMPGPLPSTSGYTYAVELSADEAIAAGATDVLFDRPVAVYVDNFLNFPTGIVVPVGSYDRAKAAWIASRNGRVVKILEIANGRAVLDVDGSGIPASVAALTLLGIDDAELVKLAELFQSGQTLWRIQVTHFTPYDCNWPIVPSPGARAPDVKHPDLSKPPNKDCRTAGSIIGCERQTLGERLAVAGTSLSLNYQSDRADGYRKAYSVDVSLGKHSLPPNLLGIRASMTIAGQATQQSFPALPNQIAHFEWDGKDLFGRNVEGAQNAHISVVYLYAAQFTDIPALALDDLAFARFGDESRRLTQARVQFSFSQQFDLTLGSRATATVGGWSLDVHHSFDPDRRAVYLGDGTKRSGGELPTVATTVAIADCRLDPDTDECENAAAPGARAVDVSMSPRGMGLASDGSMYLADSHTAKIWRVNPAGTLDHVAGNGSTDFNGDGIPATEAGFFPTGPVHIGPDNSIYFASDDGRIRRVDKDGIITTAVGTGVCADSIRTEIPANQADLCADNFTLAKDGTLYVLDSTDVYRIGADRIIRRIVGDGSYATCDPTALSHTCADGRPANSPAVFHKLTGIAVGADGTLYLANGEAAESDAAIIYRIGADGVIRRVAGNGNRFERFDDRGNGKPAIDAVIHSYFVSPAVGPDGTLYFASQDGYVSHVDQAGRLRILVGCVPNPVEESQQTDARRGTEVLLVSLASWAATVAAPSVDCSGDGRHRATLTRLSEPRSLAFGPDGKLYVLDDFARSIDTPLPEFGFGDVLIASEDASELYLFNADGRHLRTLDALLGHTIYEFAYDVAGLLSTITDGDGNAVRVERDGAGAPTAIVAPFGQRTTLTLDSGKHLATLTRPGEPATTLTYSADGLLKTFTDGGGNLHQFTYDENGLLVRDDDPAGGFKSLVRTQTDSSSAVTVTTALERSITHGTIKLSNGGMQRRTLDGAGLSTISETGPNGTVSLTAPDGTITSLLSGADPRFGMTSPVMNEMTMQTPDGFRTSVTRGRRTVLSDPMNPLSVVSQIDSAVLNGRVFRTTYVAATKTFTSATPVGRSSTTRLDAAGRVVEGGSPGITPAQFEYDGRGRPARLSQGSRQTTYAYDAQGRLSVTTDPLDRTSQYFYDASGRLSRETMADGREVLYSYDISQNVRTVRPPGRASHQFQYNSLNLLRSYNPPSLGSGTWSTTYQYDLDRNLTQIVRPDGQTVDLGYDAAGRTSSLTLPGGVVNYGYHSGTGIPTTISGPYSGNLSFVYDGPLLTSVEWTGEVAGTITATYNSTLQVAGLSVNGETPATVAYDDDGLLRRAGAITIDRNATNGLMTGTTLGSITTSQSYTSFGELARFTANVGGAPLFDVAYVSDALGRITGSTETADGTTTSRGFSYDLAGRLTEVRVNGTLTAINEYDGNGNRVRVTSPSGVLVATYDEQDRMLAYGNTSYTYGRNGELRTKTREAEVSQYEYDVLGNLRRVTLPDGNVIDYVVDGINRRVGKKVNGVLVQGFLYQGQLEVAAELNGAGNVVSRFVYGSRPTVPDYLVKSGTTYRLVSDPLGSVRMVVDVATGAVVQRIDYDEWGNVTQDTNPGFQPFGFAGGIYEPQTGLIRFGARDYDPVVGRWTAKDPIGFSGGSLNLYSYVNSDPVSRSDPTGLDFWVTWHEVANTNRFHTVIWWNPGSDFNPNGIHRTFGAAPRWFGCDGGLIGCLNAGHNRDTDYGNPKDDWTKLALPCGTSAAQMLQRLFDLQTYYMKHSNDKIPYDALAGYSSNSYTRSLANAAGFTTPATLRGRLGKAVNVPGWGNPLPVEVFGK